MNTKTRRTIPWVGILASCLLAGCAGSSISRPGPYVKPGLVMVPADQAKYYGLGAQSEFKPEVSAPFAPTDLRSVQTDSEVTAIQYNRYADPAHPTELMHEAHIVYRRDTPPRWRLNAPSAAQQILVGPQITDGRGEVKCLAAPELDAYLREQRTTLRRQEETLTKITDTMRQMAEQQKLFAEQLARVDAGRHDTGTTSDTATPPPSSNQAPNTASHFPHEKTPAAPEKEVTEIPER